MANEPSTATFVFADLAGYTALTEAHGDAQAADAAANFVSSVRKLVSDYSAEVVKTIGDALLIRVPSADQAVRLAARIVEDLGARERSLGVRIGMHTGTAVQREQDWFGGGVNIAARIADLAGPGEILMSGETQRVVNAVEPGQLEERGQRELKHVREPVQLYALHPAGDPSRQLPIDPVCHMALDPERCQERRVHRGVEYHFCSASCATAFDRSPDRFVGRRSSRATLLVSDRARDSALRGLTGAYTKGRLERDELEQRTQRALKARTRAELATATYGLPRRRRSPSKWQWPIWPFVILSRRVRRVIRARPRKRPS